MISSFKLFEEIEGYQVLATNDSYHSWEYDSHHAHAEILLGKIDGNLYLRVTDVHVKSGLGAGTFPKPTEFVKIGDLYKADLALVRSILKKHQYDQSKFKRFWQDEEGNKMSLTDLLKMYKPEKPKKELKHIKSISNFEPVNEPVNEPVKSDIELVRYSDRSYALFGEGTKEIKDKLSYLGCRYNKFLTDPATGEKRPGWVFSLSKLEKVEKLLNKKAS